MSVQAPPEAAAMTLAEASRWVADRLEDGVECPACNQHAQVYRWSLYRTAVRALVLFYKLGGTTDFVHVSQLKAAGHQGQGDVSRLRHWGLVEEEKTRRPDGGRPGYWRVTQLGADWLEGRVTVPKYVNVYNGKVTDTYGEPVRVQDSLGNDFDLRALSIAGGSA